MTRVQDHETITWTAGPEDSGQRLDRAIASIVAGCARSTAVRLIREGWVRVNGSVKKPGYRLAAGDTVSTVAAVPAGTEKIIPEPIPLDIVFKDSAVIIINKPPGLVVHPAAGNFSGTLVHGLLYHFPELQNMDQDTQRPGIVHRLDKDTSGIMVIAKTPRARQELLSQFKSRIVKKTYITFVHGEPEDDEGKIVLPISRHPVNRKKMAAGEKNSGKQRHAETLWRVKDRFGNIAMLECIIKTGRTHQIRVHLSSIGHPVIGDRVYGYKRPLRHYQERAEILSLLARVPRQMLHAGKIEFMHPKTGKQVSFTAPLPRDMEDLREALLEYKNKNPESPKGG
ncbi:MAG: RluA family pseudouridine synthase [Desulfobacteraceae bacterium]|nr:RluA family pseudouridine synthase [Desulfobacteraceae bacterium]